MSYSPEDLIGKITLGDCMYYMPMIPWLNRDVLAIVDPPYFKGPESKIYYGNVISKTGIKRLSIGSDCWDKVDTDYFDELNRISNKYVFWGSNYYNFNFHSGRIIWDKVNRDSSFSDCEIASTNIFDHVRKIDFMWNGMMQGKSITEGRIQQGNKKLNEKRIHCTQKPIVLYRWVLKKFATRGQLIVDTHSGSGSLACACHLEGFDFIAIEKDAWCHKDSVKRLNELRDQALLF